MENYLGRVTKPRILETVREAKGEQAVQLIGHLKKADMAREAERLLEGSGWLPEPLRGAEDASARIDAAGDGGELEQLPDFLTHDGEVDTDRPETADDLIAAE